jgi:MFS transporter, OFA family, oxalate/formate antiporter
VGTQIPVFLILPNAGSMWLFVVLCCYIMLCYGGGFGTMPAFAADTFGPKYIGGIYGPILLAWGAAGIAGPMLMEYLFKLSGNYNMGLQTSAISLGLALILMATYRKPELEAAKVRAGE